MELFIASFSVELSKINLCYVHICTLYNLLSNKRYSRLEFFRKREICRSYGGKIIENCLKFKD